MSIRPIRIEGDVAYVPLTQGYEAVIDAADAHLVAGHNWCAMRSGKVFYAVTNVRVNGVRAPLLRMHRLIAGTPAGIETDHANGNGLDNRRANLRNATRSENQRNRGLQANSTSGLKGVWRRRDCDRWQAAIQIHGKRHYIGLFDSQEKAYSAYLEAAHRIHGEFARAS